MTATCPTCGEPLEVTIEDGEIVVPEGHLGCGYFSPWEQETMRAQVRERNEVSA